MGGQVLEHWRSQGHRALFFTQTQQMLDIIERNVQNAGIAYHRMDGSTAVAARARLVDDFNDNDRIFVFLLTTKVGGIGINLTGADRSDLGSRPANRVAAARKSVGFDCSSAKEWRGGATVGDEGGGGRMVDWFPGALGPYSLVCLDSGSPVSKKPYALCKLDMGTLLYIDERLTLT